MNMNRIVKLSAAVTLGLSLMGASLAADAASASSSQPVGQVVHLGTITVTRADEAGKPKPKARVAVGGTAFLGQVHVTGDDTPEARAAADAAHKQGAVFLGEVIVTPKDSEEVRYAAAQAAAQPGVAFIGTVDVSARDTKPAFVGKAVLAVRRVSHDAMVSMISALAFVRVGG